MTLGRSLLAVTLVGVVFPSAAADLLNGGSFEAPTVPRNTYQQAIPDGWSWQGPSGLLFNGLVLDIQSGTNWPTAQAGDQFVDIGNVSSYSLSQGFAVAASGTYQLSWFENAHVNANSSPYSVSVRDTSLTTLFEVNLNAANVGTWEHQLYSLNLGPGSYMLTFTAQGVPQGYDSLLDDVSITSVVPEPAPWVLLAFSLPLLLIRAMRLRRSIPSGFKGTALCRVSANDA